MIEQAMAEGLDIQSDIAPLYRLGHLDLGRSAGYFFETAAHALDHPAWFLLKFGNG